jgi:hypothetical protein
MQYSFILVHWLSFVMYLFISLSFHHFKWSFSEVLFVFYFSVLYPSPPLPSYTSVLLPLPPFIAEITFFRVTCFFNLPTAEVLNVSLSYDTILAYVTLVHWRKSMFLQNISVCLDSATCHKVVIITARRTSDCILIVLSSNHINTMKEIQGVPGGM